MECHTKQLTSCYGDGPLTKTASCGGFRSSLLLINNYVNIFLITANATSTTTATTIITPTTVGDSAYAAATTVAVTFESTGTTTGSVASIGCHDHYMSRV